MQTRPGAYAGMGDGLVKIQRTEGWPMLFQGAGATGVGYFLYGATIYPGYEFWKRYFFTLAGPAAMIANRVPLVLLAGATATILTCFFITPFETVRIKMVEEPGFAPTLKAAFARVKAEGGFALFYDGLLPLMIRQVLFGMMKFLIFDMASDFILGGLPSALRASVVVALLVSLLSGAIAGVFSAIVSQPADVVLSRVAKGAKSGGDFLSQVGNIFGEVRAVWTEFGVGGFFLGLGSRCIWSGAIIAGQFFLYDVFKNWLHVAETDLGQFYDALSATSAFSS
jgi:solute carrier family 25 phosphate transporter 3